MENVYRPDALHDLFVVLGSSASALVGLLFIATSLHLKEVVNNPALRRRAFNNTCYLLIILVETLFVLIPQPLIILGAEVICTNLVGFWLLFGFVSAFFTNRESYKRAGGGFHRAIIFIAGFLLGIVGGIILIRQLNWGIYFVIASSIILLVRVVFSAWSIMVRIGESENASTVI
jgi:hypothetical protein